MSKKILIILAVMLSSSLLAKGKLISRKLSSTDSGETEVYYRLVYRGFPLVISKDLKILESSDSYQDKLTSKLCKKVGASKGYYEGLKLVSYGKRGPDLSAYVVKDSVVLKEDNDFVSAEKLVCVFDNIPKCDPKNGTIFDIFFPEDCE